jgi:diguanylate cyclase (GGDEF)-like protein/PAS domain S-box-containing protein
MAATKISRGKRTELALYASEERYRALVEHLPVGVYRTTPDGMLIEANPALARMLGFKKPAALLRHNVKDFYVKRADRQEHLEKLAVIPTYFTEFELRQAGGRKLWVRDYSRAIKGPDGAVLHFDGILLDITDRKRAAKKLDQVLRELQRSNKKLENLSLTDELTGLHNRRGFFTLGLQQLKIAKRLEQGVFLIFLDIDDLKQINDTYGHPAGDDVLKAVATILRTTLRESDIFGRIGGDEFAVLAIRSKKAGERTLANRLETSFASFSRNKPRRLHLSVSMGVVRFDPGRFGSLEELLARADDLMYQQKRSKTRHRV